MSLWTGAPRGAISALVNESLPFAIERQAHGDGGRYVIDLPGGAEAEMTYRLAGGVMAIDHTLVPPAFEGRGIAAALVNRAIADARAENFKIAPICSYVAAQFQRHREWADLLAR